MPAICFGQTELISKGHPLKVVIVPLPTPRERRSILGRARADGQARVLLPGLHQEDGSLRSAQGAACVAPSQKFRHRKKLKGREETATRQTALSGYVGVWPDPGDWRSIALLELLRLLSHLPSPTSPPSLDTY